MYMNYMHRFEENSNEGKQIAKLCYLRVKNKQVKDHCSNEKERERDACKIWSRQVNIKAQCVVKGHDM